MRSALTTIILAAAFALGTWLAGWWMVPLIAAAWAVGRPAPFAGLLAAIAGASGWALLLTLYLVLGFPVATLAVRLAGAMRLPVSALVALTLLLPALLAGSAAVLATAARPRRAIR
jgi:hypothetical protein